MAKRDEDLTISVYATIDSKCDTFLGKVEGNLEKVDCTGEEMSSNVSLTQIGTPFTLKFRFEPRSRLFGLIIGIDKYRSGGIRDLNGCTKDAQSVVDLLSRKFHIRSSHFLCLANERATRSAIIDGFQCHLIENKNIERGDAILLFYAGHGSRAAAPRGWVADERQVETICPHDERTFDFDGKEIFGIPDRTFGGLLRKLCFFKGDNITVICDSCHSGGNTRTLGVARQVGDASPLPEDLDKNMWAWGLPPAADSNVPKGFLDMTMSSHVLLAACRHDEVAIENPSTDNIVHGAFTRCLVNLLDQEKDLSRIIYSALIDRLPPLENQHPQCNGKNRVRALFGGAANHPTLFKLSKHGGTYRAGAGSIHGVVKGTPFAIHALGNTMSLNSEIGVLEADSVFADQCTLRWRSTDVEFSIPPGAKALMLHWRQAANVLKVFIEPPCDHDVQCVEHIFSLVNSSESADLVIRRTRGGTLQFERLDLIMSKYAQLLDDIPPDLSLSDVLKDISHFNYHLSRGNTNQPLKNLIEVVLHRLTQSNPDQISEEAIYMPDGDTGMTLVLGSGGCGGCGLCLALFGRFLRLLVQFCM